MRKAALTYCWAMLLASFVSMAACDRPVIKVTTCAVADERLSVAFKNPPKAKAYLTRLAERLKEREPKAIDDAADLVKRFAACIE